MDNNEKYLTVTEVASRLKYSERWVRQACKDGVLSAIRTGPRNKWLIAESSLDSFNKRGNERLSGIDSTENPEDGTEQEPGIGSKSHAQAVRDTAKNLISMIRLPDIGHLYVRLTDEPGIYEEVLGGRYFGWSVNDDRGYKLLSGLETNSLKQDTIANSIYRRQFGIENPDRIMFESLIEHISTSRYASSLGLMDERKSIGGVLLVKWAELVHLVHRNEMYNNPSISMDYKRLDKFCLSICVYAVYMASGKMQESDLVYSREWKNYQNDLV